jgi:prepilin-type N-terminal cleavage/methylation domain-containing protein
MKREWGFSLVELLIVVSILAVMVTIWVATFNPTAMVNRGNDARRKKDLQRIKVALEEYLSDKGCYPGSDLVTQMNEAVNCDKTIFSPWLKNWPCDPLGRPYYVIVEDSGCPKWFKVLTELDNHKDRDIPMGWYQRSGFYHVGDIKDETNFSSTEVNYGTSSTNVAWYDYILSESCEHNCYTMTASCNKTSNNTCSGDNCYRDTNCSEKCRVNSCP